MEAMCRDTAGDAPCVAPELQFPPHSKQWQYLLLPCGWTDRRTDMTRVIVAFCNYANALKNHIPINITPHAISALA